MAEINVNKLSVKNYLETGAKSKFLIPDYQRPYSWGEDEVVTLWNDITTYFHENGESDYFCGTVVTYKNDEQENEIIDGQQRTTTLLLLLRSIYSKLENHDADSVRANHLKKQIEPCLWKIDRTTGIPNKEKILINSKVASDKHNETFLEILRTGETDNCISRYNENYKLLQSLVDEQARNDPIGWYELCVDIIDRIILLPIECEDQDTALTIFSTLNDRGMSLTDSDIFKARIYNNLKSEEEKNEFIENWKIIEEQTKRSGIDIRTLFSCYMFYLRAHENDISATTPGLRKYFAKDNFKKLYTDNLISDLKEVSNLLEIINNREEFDEYEFSKNFDIKKSFDILKQYSSEYWTCCRHSVINYFLTHRNKDNFTDMFNKFLRKLIAYSAAKLTIKPTITSVKNDFLHLNRDVLYDTFPALHREFTEIDREELEDSLLNKVCKRHKATKPLLYILAYNDIEQKELLREKIDIEHILPRKWSQANLFNYNKEDVESEIESLGNKIVLEKTTNIKAGNNSFATKKDKYYKNNKIAIVKKLCTIYTNNDFTPKDIRKRSRDIKDEMINIFENWGLFEESYSEI